MPKIIGAYTSNWAIYSPDNFRLNADSPILSSLTHLFFAFRLLNPSQKDYDYVYRAYINDEIEPPFAPKPYDPNVPEGSIVSHDLNADNQIFATLRTIKQKHPRLKIMLSIGGWSLSYNFGLVFSSEHLRLNMVNSVVSEMETHTFFDGIDCDWEYPGKPGYDVGPDYTVWGETDPYYFVIGTREIRAALNELGARHNRYYELSSAAGVDPVNIAAYKGTHEYFDFINLMTYDMAFTAPDLQGHQAALKYNSAIPCANPEFTVERAVANFLAVGFSRDQLVVGFPSYGRAMTMPTPVATNRVYQEACSTTGVVWADLGGDNIISYHQLEKNRENGWLYTYDPIAEGAALYNQSTKLAVTYDDIRAANAKATYVVDQNLGGIFTWRLEDLNRTTFEPLSSCVCIVQGGCCLAETTTTETGKIVQWPDTGAGMTVSGTCASTRDRAPTRTCISHLNWGPVMGDCVGPHCPAKKESNADWPDAWIDDENRVIGVCANGFTGSPSRYCEGPDGEWGTIYDPCYGGNDMCPGGIMDNALWPASRAQHEPIEGECIEGYMNGTPGVNPSRMCSNTGWSETSNKCVASNLHFCEADVVMDGYTGWPPNQGGYQGTVQDGTCISSGKKAKRYCDEMGTWRISECGEPCVKKKTGTKRSLGLEKKCPSPPIGFLVLLLVSFGLVLLVILIQMHMKKK